MINITPLPFEPDEYTLDRAFDQSVKADAGKLQLSLVPPEIVYAIARVRRFGCQKYHDPDNWKKVEIERYWDAMLRHIFSAWDDLENIDSDSGLLSLEHAACNLDFILQLLSERRHRNGSVDGSEQRQVRVTNRDS